MFKEKEKNLKKIVEAYDELVVYNRRRNVQFCKDQTEPDAEKWHGVLTGVYNTDTGFAEKVLYNALYQWFCNADDYYEDSATAVLPVLTANAENRASSDVGLDAWTLFKGLLNASVGESLKYNVVVW